MDNLFQKYNFGYNFSYAANSDIAQSYENPNIDKDNTLLTTYNILEMMKKYDVKTNSNCINVLQFMVILLIYYMKTI